MRKVFWKIATCISVVLLTFCIYSCSNDDEDSVGSREMLIGNWNGIYYLSQGWDNGELTVNEKEDFVNGTERYSIELKEDGTYIEKNFYSSGNIKNTSYGTWSYSGQELTLKYEEYEDLETWIVTKMTDTELIYERRGKEKEDGTTWEFFEEYSFVR